MGVRMGGWASRNHTKKLGWAVGLTREDNEWANIARSPHPLPDHAPGYQPNSIAHQSRQQPAPSPRSSLSLSLTSTPLLSLLYFCPASSLAALSVEEGGREVEVARVGRESGVIKCNGHTLTPTCRRCAKPKRRRSRSGRLRTIAT